MMQFVRKLLCCIYVPATVKNNFKKYQMAKVEDSEIGQQEDSTPSFCGVHPSQTQHPAETGSAIKEINVKKQGPR